jgi:excisionase family DNA binding protein
MVSRFRQSPGANPRFANKEVPKLACSKEALAVALNLGSDSGDQPLRPLTVSVSTAATLLGVGTTTIWSLIGQGRIEVIRIGRRTLPTMASLERFVADAAASSRQAREGAP